MPAGQPAAPKHADVWAHYTKKLTEDFRTYFLYAKLGMAVFFNEDGKTVHSFIFQTQKAAGKSSPGP